MADLGKLFAQEKMPDLAAAFSREPVEAAPPAAPEVPPADPTLGDYAKVGFRALAATPRAVASGVISTVQGVGGVEAPGQEDVFEGFVRETDRQAQQRQREVAQQFPESTGIQTLSRADQQLGFSLPSMAAGIAAGVGTAAATANPITPFVAGGAAAGGTAYRSSSAQIMRSYVDALDEEKRATTGQGLTAAETETAKADFENKATEYGLWEALPEAVGGAVAGRLIFGPIKKMVGEKLARSMMGKIGAAAGTVGEELATETVTQIGQSKIASELPGSTSAPMAFDKPADWAEAFKEIAPDTLLMTALMGGGAKVGQMAYQRRQEGKLAESLGIDRPVLRQRVQDILAFKAANPDVELSTEEVNTYLAGAVKAVGAQTAPQPVVTQQPPSGEQQAVPVVPAETPPINTAPTLPIFTNQTVPISQRIALLEKYLADQQAVEPTITGTMTVDGQTTQSTNVEVLRQSVAAHEQLLGELKGQQADPEVYQAARARIVGESETPPAPLGEQRATPTAEAPPIDRTQALRDQTFARLGEGRRAEALRQTEEFKRKQAKVETILDKPAEEQTKSDQVFIQRNPEVVNEVSAMRQERAQEQAPVRDLRPEPQGDEGVVPPSLQAARDAEEAVYARKPKPLKKSQRGDLAAEAAHEVKVKAWRAEYKDAVKRTAAVEALPAREVITPAEDMPAGLNAAGEPLYDRADGSRYRMRTDVGPTSRPDFGGDLAPVQSAVEPTNALEQAPLAVAPVEVSPVSEQASQETPEPAPVTAPSSSQLSSKTVKAANAVLKADPEAQVEQITSTTGSIYLAVTSQGKTTLFAPDGRQVPGTVSAENAVAKARAEGRISPVSRVTKGKNKGTIKLAEQVAESPVVALNREIGKKVGRPTDAYVEVPPPVYLEAVIEPLGKALGKQIVFFRGKDAPMAINGATNVLPDVLFINADSTKPHMQIIGHEFLHNLKVEDIEGYHELVKAVRSVIPEKRFQQYWKAINEKRAAEGAPAMSLAKVEEEVVADVFGDRFTEKEFWNKVEQKNPEGFAGVVQRMIDFIDKVRSAFTGRQGRDMDQVREVAAEVLARHIKRHPEDATEVAEEPLPAFADQLAIEPKRNFMAYVKALRAETVATDLLPKMLLVTPMKTMVDTFSPTIPRLNDLYKAQKALGAVRNEIIDYAGLLHQDLTKMGEKGPGIKAVNNTAALASFNQMWPNKELLDQDWVPANGADTARLAAAEKAWSRANMDTSTGMSFEQAWQQSKDAYDALGSENLKDAYLRAVESMGELRAREKEALLRLIEQSTVDNPGLREELLNRLELSFSTLKGAYWPLYREGDFILEFMEGETRQVMHFETNFELQQAKATLTELGVAAETFREDYKRAVQRGEAVLPQQLMTQLSGAVEQSFMAGVDQTDTEAVGRARERSNETLRDMTEIWLRWMPETSALKNSIKRRNVKGFSPNMLRGYLKYMQAHGNRVANLEEGRKAEAILNQIENDIKERRAQGISVIREGIVLRDLRAREAAQNIQVNKFARALGKTTSFWYMTSPSIALVQMTQLGVLTFPKLATMFSLPQATTSITKGLQAATSPKYTRKAMFSDDEVTMLFDDMQAVVTSENRQEGQTLGEPLYGVAELRDRINKLQPDQQRLLALRVAMARNLLDISLTHEVNEIAQGGDPNQLHNRVFRGMMSFMRVSETASRKAAILATFDAAIASGQDFFAAMEAVDEVVESTLYNYSKEAKGVLLQGSTARVLLTFQTFRIMTAAKMIALFKQSFAAESAEVKAAARKELIGIFGMSGLLAGTMGMPMAAILFKLIDAVLGDEDEPFDSEQMFKAWLTENFGQTGADVIAEGPASLLGTALSRRIGLGDVFGSATEMPAHLHGDGAAAWWATHLIGPTYSMISGWAKGYDLMVNEGEIMKGLEAAAPKPLKDVLKAYGYATDGLKTGTGKRLMTADEIDANEVLLMALGFQPLEVSRMRDKQYDMQRLGTMLSRRRGQIVQNFVKAYSEGEDTTDAMDALQEFNRKNPEFAIGGGDLRRGLKTWQMGDLGVESRREMLLQRRMAQ